MRTACAPTTQEAVEGVPHQYSKKTRRYRETEKRMAREELGKYFSDVPAKAATAIGLKPEALCRFKIGGSTWRNLRLSARRAGEWFETVPRRLNRAAERGIAERVTEGDPRAAVGSCSMSASNT